MRIKGTDIDLAELKLILKENGYRLVKIPVYTCTCISKFPRIPACLDNYEPVEVTRATSCYTHCRRKT